MKREGSNFYKHGQHDTRLHRIWWAMISRCCYKGDTNFQYYGARGISVCKEWRHDFCSFATWAEKTNYSDDLTLDRIDVNGNYEPENCRWATMHEQFRNRRSNVWIEVNGIRLVQQDWATVLGVTHGAIIYAEKRGIPKAEYVRRKLASMPSHSAALTAGVKTGSVYRIEGETS